MLMDLLASFADYLLATKSRRTRANYTCRVRAYLRTLQSDEDFTPLNVRAYKDRLGESHRPRSVASHISAIRSFGAWCVAHSHLAANPAADIKTPKLDPPERDTPSDDDIAQLFDALPRIYRPYRRALAEAVLSISAYAGLRRGELLSLRVSDINLGRNIILVRHGKGDKPRVVPIFAECREALIRYLKLRPTQMPKSRPLSKRAARAIEALWVLRVGVPLADDGLRELLRELHAAAGMQGSRSLLPHGFRHAFATRMYEGSKDLKKVGGYLGHSNPATTALYVHNDVDSLREIVQFAALRRSSREPGGDRVASAPISGSLPSPAPPQTPAPSDRPSLHLIDDTKQRPTG